MSRPATDLHPAHIARMRRSRDVAYACFAYFGVMLTAAFIANQVPTTWLIQHWIGAVLSLPVVMAGFIAAGLVGIAYSVQARDEAPLLVLAAMTVAIPILLLVQATTSSIPPWLGTGLFTVYTLAALLLPLEWFTRSRRAWQTPSAPRPSLDAEGGSRR
jgi:hypothetical protein